MLIIQLQKDNINSISIKQKGTTPHENRRLEKGDPIVALPLLSISTQPQTPIPVSDGDYLLSNRNSLATIINFLQTNNPTTNVHLFHISEPERKQDYKTQSAKSHHLSLDFPSIFQVTKHRTKLVNQTNRK